MSTTYSETSNVAWASFFTAGSLGRISGHSNFSISAQEGVSAIWFTTEAFPPVQDYLNQVKIPGATAGGIGAVLADVGDSKKYKYAFSTGAGTSGETSIIPLLAYAASAGDTVAMLDDSSAFGTAQSELTMAIAERDFPDVTIVHKTFPNTASDNTAELSELRDSGAQSPSRPASRRSS